MAKLTKECAKSLLDEFNSAHAKFKTETIASEVSSHVVRWFEKRDRGIKLEPVPTGAGTQPNVIYLKFKGSTKDADFTFTGALSTYSVPSGSMSFAKALSFSVDKSSFSRVKI